MSHTVISFLVRSRKNISMGFLYQILLLLMVIMHSTAVSALSPVELSVYPASKVVKKGQEFSINISIDPVNNSISAAQFNLLFNSSFVEVRNVTEGNLLKQNGAATVFNPGVFNNSRGTLTDVWGLIITPGANITAKGILATITMYAKDTGISRLNITNVIISNPKSNPVQTHITNGSTNVSSYGSTNISSYDTISPASISNLRNSSYTQSYVNWTWTDPADSDFSKVMIYINGKFKTNISKGIRYYRATSLIPNILYNISTHTVDTSGNINKTWKNHTARTAKDSVPPASITNLKNVSYSWNYINWTWTDPADSDFSKVMIYINGKFKTNISKGIRYYRATTLIPNTAYTVSTHTVDTSDNINKTWKNHTARTNMI